MKTVQAAVLQCRSCDCESTYEGPLDVGAATCGKCSHPLVQHVIRTHAAMAEDPQTGAMSEDFELFPRFK